MTNTETPEVEFITLDVARDLLRRAMETQGRDFQYSSSAAQHCWYHPQSHLDTDDPRRTTGCLIGTALKLHGFEVPEDWENIIITGLYPDPDPYTDQYEFPANRVMSRDAAEYFGQAQSIQDFGHSWGAAYDAAEDSVTNPVETDDSED